MLIFFTQVRQQEGTCLRLANVRLELRFKQVLIPAGSPGNKHRKQFNKDLIYRKVHNDA